MLNFGDQLVLVACIWWIFFTQDLQFGFNSDHFLVLQGFLIFLLVLHLSDVVLNVTDEGLKMGVFLCLILKFGSEFQDCLFQEVESELILTCQQNVENGSNSDLHLFMVDWDEFIIFGGEGFLDFVKRQKRTGFQKSTVQCHTRLRLDDQLIILLFEGKTQKSLLLLNDIVLLILHALLKYNQFAKIKSTRSGQSTKINLQNKIKLVRLF